MNTADWVDALLAVGERVTDDVPCVFITKQEGQCVIRVGGLTEANLLAGAEPPPVMAMEPGLDEALVLALRSLLHQLTNRVAGDQEALDHLKTLLK